MICKNCKKQINADEAYSCDFCGSDYCQNCVSELGICDCYGDFKRYS